MSNGRTTWIAEGSRLLEPRSLATNQTSAQRMRSFRQWLAGTKRNEGDAAVTKHGTTNSPEQAYFVISHHRFLLDVMSRRATESYRDYECVMEDYLLNRFDACPGMDITRDKTPDLIECLFKSLVCIRVSEEGLFVMTGPPMIHSISTIQVPLALQYSTNPTPVFLSMLAMPRDTWYRRAVLTPHETWIY